MSTPLVEPERMQPNTHALGDPRAISDHDFPKSGAAEEQLRFLLHYGTFAPSVLNTQPWRFAVDGSTARIYADRSRQLKRLDPDGRELTVSCGAALLNLRVAARHFGLNTKAYPFPVAEAPDLLAGLVVHGSVQPTDDDNRLFHAMERRRTNRHPFADVDLPEGVLATMERAARDEGARLEVLNSPEQKAAVARLVDEGVRLLGQDPHIVAELDAWLRPSGDPRRDGVSDALQGAWDRLAHMRTPASMVASGKRALVADSPAVLILATDGDTPADWLAAGQALGRVLLSAAAHGLQASYVNQPVEVPALRLALADLIGGGYPQVVFRVGFPARKEGTPRRHMRDVLVDDSDE